MHINRRKNVPIKIWASQLEEQAERQLENLATLPFIHSHVAVMPDAHTGKGSTVGTVIATRGAIIPAAVGVDIGCGMAAVQLPFSLDRLAGQRVLHDLRHEIERSVPTGFYGNRQVDPMAEAFFAKRDFPTMSDKLTDKALLQCGSLGGGNHFIEVCGDQHDNAWIVLHSGSRGVGNTLAEQHIHRAKGLMREAMVTLPDPDLAYLVQGTPAFDAYVNDLLWAQEYAALNRTIMVQRVLRAVLHAAKAPGAQPLQTINCHHNYSAQEDHFGARVFVTRKGAVSARTGEWGIIPGSMGTKSYIVQGKGNPESFCSCSHGAGRAMSRTKARKTFSTHDLAQQTTGVECRKDAGVLDELPAAYKDIDQVMRDQADLVDVRFALKQVLCVKG